MHRPARQSSAAIEVRDAEAMRIHLALPRKRKAIERVWAIAEGYNMQRADKESKRQQSIDVVQDELRALREAKFGHPLPKPAFKHRQSVLQWWAHWMSTATTLPKTYRTTHRPAWYVGEVLTYAGYLQHRYAGQVYYENFYHVF